MDKKSQNNNESYKKLKKDLETGEAGRCYVFHGVEQYLLMNSLERLRRLICPDGLDSFNYKRFDNASITPELFEDAIEMFPLTAQRTLIEVHDYQLFTGAGGGAGNDENDEGNDEKKEVQKNNEKLSEETELKLSSDRERICALLADLPEHACIVFVYTAKPFKQGDKRKKAVKAILEAIEVVEFGVQDSEDIIKWVKSHFHHAGKEISTADARYLIQITDGLMSTLNGEIEKVAAYARDKYIERSDIDAVVVPSIDAVIYKLTDAIIRGNRKVALSILEKLFAMQEVPHKLMYSISAKMRQLLAARVCIEHNVGKAQYIQMCGIPKNQEFTADLLFSTARNTTLGYCRKAVLLCAKAARELNSMSDKEARIIELVAGLLHSTKSAAGVY